MYGGSALAPSPNAATADRFAADRLAATRRLPCRIGTLIGDGEPYSVARAERMYFAGENDRCLGATYRGAVALSATGDDVRALARDGFLVIVEQRGARRQRVVFTPTGAGGVRRAYYADGVLTGLDDAARRWVEGVLGEVAARTGLQAGPNEVASFATPTEPAAAAASAVSAASAAPLALSAPVAAGRPVAAALSSADARETLVLAARSAQGMTSDGEKARLLVEVARLYSRDDTLRAAYLRAARTIVSDGQKRQVLEALLQRDTLDARGIASVVAVAREVVSESDRARVLTAIARRYALSDPGARRAYFGAAGEIVSEAERRGVLTAALVPGAPREVAVAVLRVAGTMVSGKERGDVLLAVAERATLADPEVRRAFFAALEGMTSDSDYRRVLAAVMK